MRELQDAKYGDTTERKSLMKTAMFDSSVGTFYHQSLWQKRQPVTEVLQLDEKCRESYKDEHIGKLFKIACLAYAPGTVNYRNQSF